MAYKPTVWVDNETPVNAENLNKLENGVAAAVVSINGIAPDENGNVEIAVSGGGTVTTVEPSEDDIPKVFITGVKPTTKDDVLAEMEYVSKTDRFHAYLYIKCQGTSSMSYDKKNFTIKMYSDEARETKLKKDFKDWNHPSNKFVLKANYIDHSHARNIVSARLWGEVVASRPDYDSLPKEMRNSPNNGAVDGFPIKVYYNGTYEGVYTWNIGKDDWMWGMDEDNANHVLLCAESNSNGTQTATPCNFRELWNGVHESNWSVEVGTNSTALKNSLNNLIQFVMDNDGNDFRNGIGNYLDIQSAIDYYIFQYEICGIDGLAKNMLLATYDGTIWRCGAYDMDSTFGLLWYGSGFVSAEYACPEDYQEDYSLLWERIETNFLPELKARQAELRKTVLSYSNMVAHFERFMDTIGLDLYAEDLTIYSIPSGSTNNIKQIRDFIRDRQAYVDAEFDKFVVTFAPCTGISLSTNTLNLTAEGEQTITATVTPSVCTDTIVWGSSNPSIASITAKGTACTITPVANGSTTITVTCGEYSASCAVNVSGFFEAVPCTGIVLNVSKLTFDGTGSQTITATVTPYNTTDVITWSSDTPTVATVKNGVVTAKENGSAIITATCGNQTASCTVSVSGIVKIDYTLNAMAPYIADKSLWTAGSMANNGVLTENSASTDRYTPKFEVQNCAYTISGGQYTKIALYDADGNSYGAQQNGSVVVPKGYKVAVCSYFPDGDDTDISGISLMPIDNSDGEYAQLALAELDWVVDGTNIRASYTGKADCANYPVWLKYNAYISGCKNAFMFYGNNFISSAFGSDVDAAKAYFAENNMVLILNERNK